MQKHQLEQRLQQLREEYAAGQKMLAESEAERAEQAKLREQLARIAGAIQVLEELTAKPAADTD